jgi:FXSXX-COOH protein
MTDEPPMDIATIEVGRLSPADMDSLGDSVLGAALRRLEADDGDGASETSTPIASFSDFV